MTIIQSLAYENPYRTVLEASINRLDGQVAKPKGLTKDLRGDTWWFRVNIDNGSALAGTDDAGSWTRTSMDCPLSRQYKTYDEAAHALNAFLAGFYADRS